MRVSNRHKALYFLVPQTLNEIFGRIPAAASSGGFRSPLFLSGFGFSQDIFSP
jgi:hypothetical protein